jgi:hypothetical protein
VKRTITMKMKTKIKAGGIIGTSYSAGKFEQP